MRKHSKETKEKMRLAKLKNPTRYWLGKSRTPKSEETRNKLSKSLMGHKGYWTGKHMTPEHRKKLSEAIKGDKSYLWKGGINPINDSIRKSLEYKLWRESVFKRDNYQCVFGGKEHGHKLQADHIKPFSLFPELRFAIDNGRTLCENCHKNTDTWGGKVRFNYKK